MSDDLYAPVDDATLRSVAAWLRRLARSYGGGAPTRFETLARMVENHNKRMAEKVRMNAHLRPPPRPRG